MFGRRSQGNEAPNNSEIDKAAIEYLREETRAANKAASDGRTAYDEIFGGRKKRKGAHGLSPESLAQLEAATEAAREAKENARNAKENLTAARRRNIDRHLRSV